MNRLSAIVSSALIVCVVHYTPVHAQQFQTVNVYFGDSDKIEDCRNVKAVPRKIKKTPRAAEATLKELFKGPTKREEKNYRVHSWFNDKSANLLKSIKIINGTAYVDLNNIFAEPGSNSSNLSTSCNSSAFHSQMEKTLLQYQSIKKVFFSIEGSYESFYGMLEMSCPEGLKECKET